MKKIIYRKEYIERLQTYKDHDLIKVVTGMRRSGKSTLLEIFQEVLLENVSSKQIQSYNFENPDNQFGGKWLDIYNEIKNNLIPGKPNYIFLDEVQNIEQFEKLVDGLFVTKDVDLYITGSNANLLSGELATLLSGRYVEISILPFSFREYLEAREIDIQNEYLDYSLLFLDYVNETSLPKAVSLRDSGIETTFEYLSALYKTVIEKDIEQRYKILNYRAFENITKFVLANIGSPLSPSSISKALKADGQDVHHHTIATYLKYLTECFFLYEAHRYDIKGKRQLATQEKYYAVDLGFRQLLVGKARESDKGHLLENIVYLELLRRRKIIWIGKNADKEVDFVTKTSDGNIEYYQVAWSVQDEKTFAREISSLESIKDNYPKYLITTDTFTLGANGIKHFNAFRWLLGYYDMNRDYSSHIAVPDPFNIANSAEMALMLEGQKKS